MLLTPFDTKRTLMRLFLFTNSVFPYVRRVYATLINFPFISTLVTTKFDFDET